MRDDSDARGRRPPGARPAALILLSGIAAVLSFSAATSTLLDDPARDGIVVAGRCFLGGALYGFAGYWLGGLALHWASRARRARGATARRGTCSPTR